MKPHRPTVKSKAAGLARAKALLRAKLGWLRGYPVGRSSEAGIRWVELPPLGEPDPAVRTRVDRARLRAATRAHRKLHREFGRALATLFGDRDAWRASVAARLELLKATVHRGAALATADAVLEALHPRPGLRADLRAARAASTPERLLRSLVWVLAERPTELRRAVHFAASHARPLTALLAVRPGAAGTEGLEADPEHGLRVAVRLCELAASHPPPLLARLAAWLAEPRTRTLATTRSRARYAEAVPGRARSGRPARPWPAHPFPGWYREFVWMVDDLATMPATGCRRSLQLLDAALPDGLFDEWDRWWSALEARLAQADGIGRSRERRRVVRARLEGVRAQIAALERKAPRPLDPAMLAAARAAGRRTDKRRARALLGAIEALPRSLPLAHVRARMLHHWHERLGADGDDDHRRAVAMLTGVRRALQGEDPHRVQALLRPWTGALADPGSWQCPEYDLVNYHSTDDVGATIGELFDALNYLVDAHAGRRPPKAFADDDTWDALYELLKADLPGERAARRLLTAIARDAAENCEGLERDLLRAADQMAGPNDERFIALVRKIAPINGPLGLSSAGLRTIVQLGPRYAETCARLIEGGHLGALLDLAAGVALAEKLGGKPPRLPIGATPEAQADDADRRDDTPPAWTARYPRELHPALLRLASIDPQAQHSASRVLGHDFPDRDRLRRELAALQRKHDAGIVAPRLARRRERLTARLAKRPRLSGKRRDRLESKLAHRWLLAHLREWERTVDRATRPLVARTLGCEAGDLEELGTAVTGLLPPILELEAPARKLGLRLLRVRLGPRPWDLREAPPNRAFLATLRRRRIDPTAWLDGHVRREAGPDGGAWTLALEDDPLEVLRMGGPFGTCLSPGDFNFFSAVTNAADINKRVLYARDAHGVVQGRCLFALTDAGHLLTFHAYAHDGRAGFAKMVRRYALELATAMRTSLASRGEVPTLVANDWYDDGPVDRTGRLAGLREGSVFRSQLGELSPSEVAAAAAAALDPFPLDLGTVGWVLELPELAERPTLIAPLLAAAGDLDDLSAPTALRAARLALPKAPSLAAGLLRRLAGGRRWRDLPDTEALVDALLLAHEPGLALRLLRRTRPRTVRRWEEDTCARQALAGRAHDALHRPRRALALYDLALRSGGSCEPSDAAACRARARELREALATE